MASPAPTATLCHPEPSFTLSEATLMISYAFVCGLMLVNSRESWRLYPYRRPTKGTGFLLKRGVSHRVRTGTQATSKKKYQNGETSDGEISGSSTEVPGPDVMRDKRQAVWARQHCSWPSRRPAG
jgi:hypothetical protein